MFTRERPIVVRKLWGGKKLSAMKGIESSDSDGPIGETIEIQKDNLSYLVKFINTSDVLSIQVHPPDDYAKIHENSLGKTECWLILEAEEGAGVYLGLKSGVSKNDLENAIKNKKEVDKLLNFYPVKRGDFYSVPAGSIHAIGKGVTLIEVQQNSGVTYRAWDWNRVESDGNPRELHIKKSLDVICFDEAKNHLDFFCHKKNLFKQFGIEKISEHRDYQFYLINLSKGEHFNLPLIDNNRDIGIINLNGEKKLNNHLIHPYETVSILISDLRHGQKFSFEAIQEGSIVLVC